MLIAESHEVVAIAPWGRVREVVGHLMEPTDCYPPRWLVRAFPTRAELDAIGTGEI